MLSIGARGPGLRSDGRAVAGQSDRRARLRIPGLPARAAPGPPPPPSSAQDHSVNAGEASRGTSTPPCSRLRRRMRSSMRCLICVGLLFLAACPEGRDGRRRSRRPDATALDAASDGSAGPDGNASADAMAPNDGATAPDGGPIGDAGMRRDGGAGRDGGRRPDASAGTDAGRSCECEPATADREQGSCGRCGMRERTRVCGADCQWEPFGEWSACETPAEAVCQPGAEEEAERECMRRPGEDGVQQCRRECRSSCTWGAWDCGFCACC